MSAKDEFIRKSQQKVEEIDKARARADQYTQSFIEGMNELASYIDGWIDGTQLTMEIVPYSLNDNSLLNLTSHYNYDTIVILIKGSEGTARIEPIGVYAGGGSGAKAFMSFIFPSTFPGSTSCTLFMNRDDKTWSIRQEEISPNIREPLPLKEPLTEETFFRAIAPLA